MKCLNLSRHPRKPNLRKVKCEICGWTGKQAACYFGHDDFLCPVCNVQSLREID